jgi:hypothetical protein
LVIVKRKSNANLWVAYYKLILLAVFFAATSLSAQWGDDEDEASSSNDTASMEVSSGGGAWGGGSEDAGPKPIEKKPYVRFVPPYDSLRELIFYEGVVDDEECETCSEDSLFARAKRYLVKRFGEKPYKKMIVEEKVNQLIYMKVTIPMVVTLGEYAKRRDGEMEYVMVLRFKDARYKYQFGNFAHVTDPVGLSNDRLKTYHEYYRKAKKGFESTDRYLIAADKEVKKMVDGLTLALKEAYKPDEDDW